MELSDVESFGLLYNTIWNNEGKLGVSRYFSDRRVLP